MNQKTQEGHNGHRGTGEQLKHATEQTKDSSKALEEYQRKLEEQMTQSALDAATAAVATACIIISME